MGRLPALRVVLVVNTRSGRGRASRIADAIDVALRRGGHDCVIAPIGTALEDPLAGAGALVVVGGDGTLHAVVGEAARSGVPVYHAPAGTENLFAREFRMSASPEAVVLAIEAGRTHRVDLGRAGGRPFALMASVGWDAAVIHALDRRRKGAISHRSYVVPILAQLAALPQVTLDVRTDAGPVIEGRRGLLVIANSRQYAMRLDPARDAVIDDGLLDLVFFPFAGRLGLASWALRALAGRHLASASIVRARAVRFEVVASGEGAMLQIDGEAVDRAGISDPATGAMTFEADAGALRVLLPAV